MMKIRTDQDEQYYKDIHDIADYYRKTKTSQRLNLIISVAYNLLILLFIVGTIMSVIRSGSVVSLFGDQQDIARRFDCVSSDKTKTDTLKEYSDAKAFVEMYGGTCNVYQITNGG